MTDRLSADGTGHAVALPDGAAGQWCRLRVRVAGAAPWWGQVSAEDTARGQVVRQAFLGPMRAGAGHGERALLMHVPAAATGLMLQLFTSTGEGVLDASTRLRVLGRRAAALRLLAGGWRKLPGCLRGDRAGLTGRVRAELGQAPARQGEPPPDAVWTHLYDRWDGVADLLAAAAGAAPAFDVLVFSGGDEAADAATIASIAAQSLAPARVRRWCAEVPPLPGAWQVVLQAGERLLPHALACFAHAIATRPETRVVVADLRSTDGILFKPAADPWLLESGLLTRGACVLHPDVRLPAMARDADDCRLQMAAGQASNGIQRIPFVLTQVPHGGPGLRPRGRRSIAGKPPGVSLIVPSACRSPHVLRCLRDVVARTDYPDFDIVLAVSGIDAGDATQHHLLHEAGQLARLRVLDLQQPSFNYALVNNLAVQATSSEFVLLLNDDVSPISPGWLRDMVAYTSGPGPAADIVGPRLLYGNDRVQHAGVILGLANLCEHAFRLADRNDHGPYGLALLDREVSAVTAACMLVRRSVWDALGGMDEGFAIALNDVDFCLRARSAGYRIVLAAGVELHHFESLSLGRHYEGSRAGLEALEVRRLRDRWQRVIADDPFYNPCASLAPGREFRPAFPPRLSPRAWLGGEQRGQH